MELSCVSVGYFTLSLDLADRGVTVCSFTALDPAETGVIVCSFTLPDLLERGFNKCPFLGLTVQAKICVHKFSFY